MFPLIYRDTHTYRPVADNHARVCDASYMFRDCVLYLVIIGHFTFVLTDHDAHLGLGRDEIKCIVLG